MSARAVRASLAGLGLMVACSSYDEPGPQPQFAYAVATRTCRPADEPGVAVYLAPVPFENLEPPAPYIRLVVWQLVEHVPGGSWFVAGGEAEAWRFWPPDSSEVATIGRIVVSVADTTATIRGSADITFPGAGHLEGAFSATWISRTLLCG